MGYIAERSALIFRVAQAKSSRGRARQESEIAVLESELLSYLLVKSCIADIVRCWKYFFGLLPSPSSLSADTGSTSNSTTYSTYSLLLSRQRSEYSDLRERFLRAPDGGWIKDGETNEDGNRGRTSSENGGEKSATGRPVKVDAKVNNPLGLEEDNPWQSWFADLELRKTIRQDVQRT